MKGFGCTKQSGGCGVHSIQRAPCTWCFVRVRVCVLRSCILKPNLLFREQGSHRYTNGGSWEGQWDQDKKVAGQGTYTPPPDFLDTISSTAPIPRAEAGVGVGASSAVTGTVKAVSGTGTNTGSGADELQAPTAERVRRSAPPHTHTHTTTTSLARALSLSLSLLNAHSCTCTAFSTAESEHAVACLRSTTNSMLVTGALCTRSWLYAIICSYRVDRLVRPPPHPLALPANSAFHKAAQQRNLVSFENLSNLWLKS